MRRLLAAAVLAVVLVASGCGSDDPDPSGDTQTTRAPGPRALTAEEADRLAVARFNNYKRDLVPFTLTVPVDAQTVTVTGRAAYRDHRAIGSLAADNPAAYGVLAWNLRAVGLLATEAPVSESQLAQAKQFPDTAWDVHDLTGDLTGSPLDAALLVLLNLALDRPENAQLLRQNGAQWQGAAEVDGTDVDLMTATPEGQGQTLTYYVDDLGNLLRVDLAVGGPVPATITFGAGNAGAVPVVTAIGQTR